MNAVVLTVKTSYIASTKYRNKSGHREVNLIKNYLFNIIVVLTLMKPIVQWKMRLPEKKSLVLIDRQNESESQIKKGTVKTQLEPLHVLSQFQN